RAGFRCGPVEMVRHSDWLRASGRLAARLYGWRHWFRWLQTRPVSGVAGWFSYLTGRAGCLLVTAVVDPTVRLDDAAAAAGGNAIKPSSRRPGDRFRNK